MRRVFLSIAIALSLTFPVAAGLQSGGSAGLARGYVSSDVSGVVSTGEPKHTPVGDALVMIAGVDVGVIRTTSTDATGRFHFTDLPAGRFLVTAGKPGYLGMSYGARRDGRPGTPLVIAAGGRRPDIALTLVRGAAISGVVSDDAGRPVTDVRVRVLQRRVVGGEAQLVAEAGSPAIVTTDDRGAYRIFDLPPGEYVVVAQPRGIAGPEARVLTADDVDAALRSAPNSNAPSAPPLGGGAAIAYAGVYFPNTPRAADATAVVLTAGEDRPHVDLSTRLVRLARVDGIVTGDARAVASLQITMRPRGFDAAGPILNTMNIRPAGDGRFTFANVPPGDYSILARTMQAPPPGGPNQPPQRDGSQNVRLPTVWALGEVSVNGENVTNVTLALAPALVISGRVVFDGLQEPPEALSNVRVGVRATPSTNAQPLPEPVTISKDGSFTISGVTPGRYWLYPIVPATDPATQIPDWIAGSAIVDGHDALDVPIDVGAESRRDVTLTLTRDFQEITGSVTSAAGHERGRTVVAFSVDKQFWFPQSRRVAIRQTDGSGAFVFGVAAGLPPGDYFVATIAETVLDNERFDPEFLSSMIKDAKRITLGKGESVQIELRSIR